MAFRTIGNNLYVNSMCGLTVNPRGDEKDAFSVKLLEDNEYYIHADDESMVTIDDCSVFNKTSKLILYVKEGVRLVKVGDNGLAKQWYQGQKRFNHQVLVTEVTDGCSYFIDSIDAPEDFSKYFLVDARSKKRITGSNSIFSKLDYFKEVFDKFDAINTGIRARLSVNKFAEGSEFIVKKHLLLLNDLETLHFSFNDVIKSMDARSFEAMYVVGGVLDKSVQWVLSISRTSLYVNDDTFDMIKYIRDASELNIKTYTVCRDEFMNAFNKVKDDVNFKIKNLEDIFVKLLYIDEVGKTNDGVTSILMMDNRPIYNYIEGYSIPFNTKIVEMIDSIISNLQLKDIGNWNNILNDYYGFNPTMCEDDEF